MLDSLKIKNIALINEATVNFNNGLNILTGETGAGKSIIIDALTFVLGERADKSLIKNGCEFAKVEAVFNIEEMNDAIIDFFKQIDIGPESTIIITRNINLQGKNECRVNGEVVTLNMLKKLTFQLVDVHGQFDHQLLLDVKTHIKMLDSICGIKLNQHLDLLRSHILKLKNIENEIKKIGGIGLEREKNIDLYRYQMNEIELANLKLGEDEELQKTKTKYLSSSKIVDALTDVTSGLKDGNYNTLSIMQNCITILNNVSQYDDTIKEQKERLNNLKYEIEDISELLREVLDSVDYSEDELNTIEERLDLIKSLIRKYSKTNDILGIFKYLDNSKMELNMLLHADEELNKLTQNKNDTLNEIFEDCLKITSVRKENALKLESNILNELSELGMGKSKFVVQFKNDYNIKNIEDHFNDYGADDIEFLFSANVGEPVKPLSKILSGGEMSRFMLAFKCVVSGGEKNKTFIFDEIDTGIGGIIGNILGQKLYKISQSNQVFSVTHLPQIACFADIHYKVTKQEEDDKTLVKVNILSNDDRLNELDRMLGSGSEYSKLHAKQIMESANSFKKLK